MDLKEIGQFVIKYAPLLGSAISQTNPLAGMVVNTIAAMFGANPQDPADIMAKMSADPEAMVKLKQIESDQKIALMQSQTAQYQAAVDDRKNARDHKDWILNTLAICFTIGFFSYLILSQLGIVPLDKGIFHDLLNEESIVLLFYFGGIYKPTHA